MLTCFSVLVVVFTTILAMAPMSTLAKEPVVRFNDFGDDDDTSPTSSVFFLPETGRWSPTICHENPDLPDGWEIYTSKYHGEPGWISFRIVLGDHYGDFYARIDGFELTPDKRNATSIKRTA